MDFITFLGEYRYTFKSDAPYINVRSIERYYVNMFGYNNTRAVFTNWLDMNKEKVIAVYMHIFNRRDDENDMISRLILRPINSSPIIHPAVALLFSFDISPMFALSTLTLFCGSVNQDISRRFIEYVDNSSQSKRILEMHMLDMHKRKKCSLIRMIPNWIRYKLGGKRSDYDYIAINTYDGDRNDSLS